MQVRWVVALLLLCRPALAQGPVVTASLDFTVGSVDSGPVHGFVAPGGRVELGVALGPLRLQAEFEGALWSLEHRKTESGSWSRTGISLRWYWLNLGGGMRVYSEAGMGRHHLALSEIEVARYDVALGVGLVEQISVGGWQLGVRMGVRALVMNSPGARPQDALVCRGGCPMPANQNADLVPRIRSSIRVWRSRFQAFAWFAPPPAPSGAALGPSLIVASYRQSTTNPERT